MKRSAVKKLPNWALELEPIGMDEAAHVLGISRRKLTTVIAQHPYFEKNGRRKIFRHYHIRNLLEAISCQNGSQDGAKKRVGMSRSQSEAVDFGAALEFVTRAGKR